MKRVTNEMVAKLNSGSSLSQAFKEHKRYFDLGLSEHGRGRRDFR